MCRCPAQDAARAVSARAQGVGVPSSFHVKAFASHRAGQHARRAGFSRHGAFAMYVDRVPTMLLALNMIVIAGDGRRFDSRCADDSREHIGDDFAHRRAVGGGITTRPFDVAQISCAARAVRIQRDQPGNGRFLCPRNMMLSNCLAHRPRPAVDHKPQSIRFVALQLDEVVAAAKSA